jgi:hypothetical protein
MAFINDNKGRMFDPNIADIFVSIISDPDTLTAY